MSDSASVFNPALNRRMVFRGLAGFIAGSSLANAQQDTFREHSRIPALNELRTAQDFEPVAHAKIVNQAYDYMAYGSDGEFTLRRNREAFDWVRLVPRRLVDVSSVRTESELLGTKLTFPIMISPSARHVWFHPDGEAATHKGATAASNTPMIISNVATLPIEKIAAAATGPVWFQLYPQREADYNRKRLELAQSVGCKAIVVTVDQQATTYERSMHDRHLATTATPVPLPTVNVRRERANPYRVSDDRLWYEWTLLDDIKRMIKVPLVVKGIITAEDARLCVEHGADAIFVSNHGGRTLDYVPSTLEVMDEIVDAVGGRVPIICDGGIRSGTDILKALALGAKAVGIGRVPIWGLAAYGAEGLQRILEILQTELAQAMAATGRPTLASIDRSLVKTEFV